MEGSARTAALEPLDALIGEWTTEIDFPGAPPSDVRGHTVFEWTLDGRFLVQRTEIPLAEAPDSIIVVSPDHDGDGFTQHYFDSRGVTRVYEMTFDGRAWTLAREKRDFTPLDFEQRFTGTFDDDGSVIRGHWDGRNEGEDWQLDFHLTYTRDR